MVFHQLQCNLIHELFECFFRITARITFFIETLVQVLLQSAQLSVFDHDLYFSHSKTGSDPLTVEVQIYSNSLAKLKLETIFM